MKTVFSMVAAFGLLVAINAAKAADEAVTLTGKAQCAKCVLGEAEKCQDALVVAEGDHKGTYYLKTAKHSYCKGTKDVKVTGKIVEKDGKKWIVDPKIEAAK